MTRRPRRPSFVFVCRTDAARGRADLHSSGRVFGGQFDHSVIGKDYLRAIADEQVSIDFYAGISEACNFFEERDGVQHHAIADHAAAILAQHTAWDQLQDETLSVNDDGMTGVVAAGVTCHDGKSFREHVDDLALAFISPLGADYDRSLACLQISLLIFV